MINNIRSRCEARLNELSRADITSLTEFGEHRLAAQGLNPSVGADVTQLALLGILRGLESDQGGRRPRLVDVETHESFLNFGRGAISSIIEAMGRKRQLRSEHLPWQDEASEAEDGMTAQNVEMTDLKNLLFPRLRARAPRHLKRTIDAWEAVFEHSDRIPAPGHRRYVGEVKALARDIVTELGGIG